MLYVSRFVGRNSYGVVDTDDGVESIVTHDDLYSACADSALDIEGVLLYETGGMKFIGAVEPYQHRSYIRPVQTKFRLMCGIEVRMYRDMITNIRWDNGDIVEPVRIKLSNFGRLCADCIFSCNDHAGAHKVTIILDDSITISESSFKLKLQDESFMSVLGIGVMMDLRGVRNDNKAFEFYRSFFNSDVASLFRSVIDHEWRKDMARKLVL